MDDRLEGDDDHLSVLRSVSLTSALERRLERLIAEGELAPGDRLNEIQLATRFGTSRGPLREATRSLEAKGFVEVIRNRGVFVRNISVEDAVEIYELRAALFGLAGRLCAQKADEPLVADLRAQVEEMEVAAGRQDFDSYYPLNIRFHQTIVAGARNRHLAAEYERFVKKMHLFRAKSLVQGGGLSVSNSEHRDMLEAIAARDPERAFAAHWAHVDRARERMLAVTRQEGEPGDAPG